MRRFGPIVVMVVLLLVVLLQPSCVLLRGGSCDADSECEAFHVCFRNWCMPETVRKRLQDVIDARNKEAKPGDAGGEVTPETKVEQAPETSPECAIKCEPGTDKRPCYTSKACTPDGNCMGNCKAGTQTCEANGACPGWSACIGEVKPVVETCNNEDDDCDGNIDEDVQKPCYNGAAGTENVGICKGGTQTCSAGQWGTCEGEVLPKTEDCGTPADDNCDGTANNGCACTPNAQEVCGSKEGECKEGTKTCSAAGKWDACVGDTKPIKETCDGKDNDCDGDIDEALTRKCYEGKPPTSEGIGICKGGEQTCNAGQWGACIGQVIPKSERCDNQDEDCDGSIDNGLTRPCYDGPGGTKGVGVCRGGTQTCATGNWGTCQGELQPGTETCNNRDDDCNGKVDETCQCKQGDTQPCGTNEGECQKGTQSCTTAGKWGVCIGEIKPAVETCNAKDDDCNGKIDDIAPKSCYTGPPNTKNVSPCKDGVEECTGTQVTCKGEIKPATEECNNIDDDCDGNIDDNVTRTCYSGAAGTQGKGLCTGGMQACTVGVWGACVGEVTPIPEKCDGSGKDYDCDGKTEDGCVTTLAGDGTAGFKDGQGSAAQFKNPAAMVVDGSDLYVLDTGNYSVRQVSQTGLVKTIAGDGNKGFTFGPALSSRFDDLCGIAKPGTSIFVTEHKTHTIRQIITSPSNPSLNSVQLFAGRLNEPGSGIVNGELSTARFNGPCGIAIDVTSNLYIAEIGNNAIRKVSYSTATSQWMVETFTGGNGPGFKDGAKGVAQFDFSSSKPKLVLYQGKLYVNDNKSIRVIDITNGTVATYVGLPMTNPTYQVIIQVDLFTFGPAGAAMYFVAKISNEIRKTNLQFKASRTFIGARTGFLDGDLSVAKFGSIAGFVTSGNNDLFIADKANHRIRKVTLP